MKLPLTDRAAYKKAWAAANRDKTRAYDKKYRAKAGPRTEYHREYRESKKYKAYQDSMPKEQKAEYSAKYRVNNKDKINALAASRRASMRNRTPEWADQEAIAYVYYAAEVINRVYGGKPHVDHIVPLQGAKVSGLHVRNNLQLLSKKDNMMKSNKYEITED